VNAEDAREYQLGKGASADDGNNNDNNAGIADDVQLTVDEGEGV
jgi:hypothetical protein